MTTYRCRFHAPRTSDWHTIEADSPEAAVQELHYQDPRPYGIRYVPDLEKPGNCVYFASIEVDGHGPLISRIYTSGITRRGGIKPARTTSLADVAEAIGWTHPPEGLLDPGWIGEESEWT